MGTCYSKARRIGSVECCWCPTWIPSTLSLPYTLTASHCQCWWCSAFGPYLAVGAFLGPLLGQNESTRGLTLLGQPATNDRWKAMGKCLSCGQLWDMINTIFQRSPVRLSPIPHGNNLHITHLYWFPSLFCLTVRLMFQCLLRSLDPCLGVCF